MAFRSSFVAKNRSSQIVFFVLVLFSLFVIVVPGYFFYLHYEKTQKQLESPTDAAREEVAVIAEKVGKLILIPSDEEPTLASVSNKSKLANQAFFERAKNGDKVLIFTKSKKAYLYRPSINKIIDVGPVNIGGQAPPPPQMNIPAANGTTPTSAPKASGALTPTPTTKLTPTPTSAFQKVNAALYNGTRTAGLAATTETTFKTKAPNVTVVAKGNAANNYTETLVIDFTGKYKKEAAELVKILGGSTGVLPKGEVKPASNAAGATADILVILGSQ